MALESKTAEQKLQKMEDSRRKNEKMAKQFEKVHRNNTVHVTTGSISPFHIG